MTRQQRFDSDQEDEEEVVPRPAALIESLRSFGYLPATSVADLIDNSISAGASHISARFSWNGPHSWFSLTDDGTGMTESGLRDAMRAGSSNPLDARGPTDLGRFGLGLKTASFAQARSLTVVSRHHGQTAVRCWDLDHVRRTNRWSLLTTSPVAKDPEGQLPSGGDGTVVAWHNMDRIVDDRPDTDEQARKAFFRTVDGVTQHLEMVFHRFISEDQLQLSVNGTVCRAWDPFLETHQATERMPNESLPVTLGDGTVQRLTVDPFVLPHRSRLTEDEHSRASGPRGWNLQQGFYLYRARRLIVAGDWFDSGLKPEEHHKLARIRVEITQDMDPAWALDVRKSRARPPGNLRPDFSRIARATRERAENVYRTRGRRAVGQSGRRDSVVPVWRVETDSRTVTYLINRDHRVVRNLTAHLGTRREVEALLRLVESTVPVAHILSQGYRDENSLAEVGQSDDVLLALARQQFQVLVDGGLAPELARDALAALQPFESMTAFLTALAEERTT